MNLLEKIAALENEAAEFGFQWETTDQIMAQIQSECIEVDEHLKAGINNNSSALQEEIGDLLHAVFSLCVFCKLDPKDTLQQTVEKFERRLRAVKMIAHEKKLINLEGQNFDDLMSIWKQAKSRVG
ncbi:TPA: nucleoside triphosphate hydrolase [Legionella pneumophila]|nr:nucleoside triphosphate hydrolase [Legionella pneumophila]HAU0297566.1 nucleoside triphosphate hydrolase [Legionella pneumophila]